MENGRKKKKNYKAKERTRSRCEKKARKRKRTIFTWIELFDGILIQIYRYKEIDEQIERRLIVFDSEDETKTVKREDIWRN